MSRHRRATLWVSLSFLVAAMGIGRRQRQRRPGTVAGRGPGLPAAHDHRPGRVIRHRRRDGHGQRRQPAAGRRGRYGSRPRWHRHRRHRRVGQGVRRRPRLGPAHRPVRSLTCPDRRLPIPGPGRSIRCGGRRPDGHRSGRPGGPTRGRAVRWARRPAVTDRQRRAARSAQSRGAGPGWPASVGDPARGRPGGAPRAVHERPERCILEPDGDVRGGQLPDVPGGGSGPSAAPGGRSGPATGRRGGRR